MESPSSGDPHSSPPPTNEEVQYRRELPIEGVIYSSYYYVISFLANYGWTVLLVLVILAIVWTNIKPTISQWLRKREAMLEEANFDPVKAEKYQDAMMRAREKMQRELEEKAQENLKTVEQREAEDRDARIKQWEEFKVVSSSQKSKTKINPREYFPMGGSTGGGGYRPQRRTLGGGGG